MDLTNEEVIRINNKLAESSFFLDKLKQENLPVAEFYFYLSAFVTATRSVPEVIHSCFSNKKEFKTWWEARMKELKENEIANHLHVKRNLTVHQGKRIVHENVTVTAQIEVPPNDTVVVSFMGKDIYNPSKYEVKSQNNPELKPKHSFHVDAQWHFLEFPEDSVIEICTRYLQMIANMAEDAVKIFNSSS